MPSFKGDYAPLVLFLGCSIVCSIASNANINVNVKGEGIGPIL